MIRTAQGRPPEAIALDYAHGLERRRRFRGYLRSWAGYDGVSDFGPGFAVWLPDTARNEDLLGRKVQIETLRVHILRRRMMEVCARIRLVRTLVAGKSDISMDAKHGTARRPWIWNIVPADVAQSSSEIGDKLQQGVANGRFISRFVSEKPSPFVVSLQVAKKSEQRWLEILLSAHRNLGTVYPCEMSRKLLSEHHGRIAGVTPSTAGNYQRIDALRQIIERRAGEQF